MLRTDDPVRASKLLEQWVELGLLIVSDPNSGKQLRRYRLPSSSREASLFTNSLGKRKGETKKE